MSQLVFVYGTLRRGRANHRLMGNAIFMGNGKTEGNHLLYCDEGDIPYLVKSEEARTPARGEVYAVSGETLAVLDELEEIPHVYIRDKVEVVLDDGSRQDCWYYHYPEKVGTLLPSCDFDECFR